MSQPATAALDHVRQSTVRVSSARQSGTGLLVDHNIVLTCAHVVKRKDEALIRIQGRDVSGTVLKRLPQFGRDAESYPFPDLAFIGLTEKVDHPIAGLRSLSLRHGYGMQREFFSYVFNREAPIPEAGPDIVRMIVQGPNGPYVKARPETGVIPGMSGAPVVDPSTGLVCGMLKYSVAAQNAVWFIDAMDIENELDKYRRALGKHEPRKAPLIRPSRGEPLYDMLMAQRKVAEELPYRVVDGRVPLTMVYVEQRAEAWQAEKQRAEVRGVAAPPEPAIISANAMLARHRNVLVVSGPGGGKSTLLQHLVAQSVKWWLQPQQPRDDEEPSFGPSVPVRCAATQLLTDEAWYQSLAGAVNADLHEFLDNPVQKELFEGPPPTGGDWLILVDGLDEIVNPDKRLKLIERLAEHVARYGNQARFVVASRDLEESEFGELRSMTVEVDRPQRLGEYNLRPFDRAAVGDFADRWYRLRDPANAPARHAGFLEQVDRGRLMALVSIPLLCTIAADVYQHKPDEPLPHGRTGLYKRFVDGLLRGRQAYTSVRDRIRDQLVDLGRPAVEFGETLFERRLECVTYLARRRLEEDIQPSVALARGWFEEAGTDIPPDITDIHIREALLSTGLVINRGTGLEFTHLSIAEYLHSGEVVRHFDQGDWVDAVSVRGTDSSALFELGRYSEDGNSTTIVVDGLAQPGTNGEYPLLKHLAEVLEDGAADGTDGGAQVAAATIRAVQDVTTSTSNLPAINQAARAVVRRALDPSPLIAVINDRTEAEVKRVEVATVLLVDGDQEARRQAADVLIHFAYGGGRPATARMPALRALTEAGSRPQRRNALQHLRSLVQSGDTPEIRLESINLLVGLSEPAEALVGMVGRHVDHGYTYDQWMLAQNDLEAVETWIRGWLEREAGQPSPEPHRSASAVSHRAWSPARTISYDISVDFFISSSYLSSMVASLVGFVPADRITESVTALIRDRSGYWLARASSATGSSNSADMTRFGVEQLVNDTSVAPSIRVAWAYVVLREVDRGGADAMMRSIVGNDRASRAARYLALNLLGLRGGNAGALFVGSVARDPAVPPGLRIEAAAVLDRCGRRAEAFALLTNLIATRDLARRWRWAAYWVQLFMPLEPAVSWLTSGTHLSDALRESREFVWRQLIAAFKKVVFPRAAPSRPET